MAEGKKGPVVAEYAGKIDRFFFSNPDSTIFYADQLAEYARIRKDKPVLIVALQRAGEGYRSKGNFPKSLNRQIESYWLSRTENLPILQAYSESFIGFTHLQAGFFREALNYILPAKVRLDTSTDKIHASFNNANAASCYTAMGLIDSASYFLNTSAKLFNEGDSADFRYRALQTLIFNRFGNLYQRKGELDTALQYYRNCLDHAVEYNILLNQGLARMSIAGIHLARNQIDSAEHYARLSLTDRQNNSDIINAEAAGILVKAFTLKGEKDSIVLYQDILIKTNENVYGREKFSELQFLITGEQLRHQQAQIESIAERNKQRMVMLGGLAIALAGIALMLRRNNMVKQNLNIKLNAQKEDLEQTLQQLRNTQTQLIQSEKMASLGELTAGIAHEIQNPLNFVNNFSEINTELSHEIMDAAEKGDLNEVKAIANDIKNNQEKIAEHGKRADSIVKNMLQHSRSSSGAKELTDLNKLADEYLRLAYHGFRAKDKSFNTELRTDLETGLPLVHVVAQDISRVLLNIFNNAFYAVNERKRTAGKEYKPEVYLSIRSRENSVIITVRDNGPGIPQHIKEKIMQPFFTTKPTGQGTGLGLSLSYDIIKAHGGEIRIDSIEGQCSEFTISLPVS